MPEGHTIHRLARDLAKDLKGEALEVTSPQRRFSEGAALVDGETLTGTEALGKHLLLEFGGERIHVHLGLFGKFRRQRRPAAPPGENKRMRLSGTEVVWDLSGPTVCALIGPEEFDALAQRIGPDPLRRDSDPQRFVSRAARSTAPMAALLLNQAAIAGVGNVYRAEFCFLAGVHPATPAKTLSEAKLAEFWNLSVFHLAEGVRLNRIVTRDPEEVGRARGRIGKGERLYVYKRAGQPCRRCDERIARMELANRKVWFCPRCQPPI